MSEASRRGAARTGWWSSETGITRRDSLRLGALGLSGFFASSPLSACGGAPASRHSATGSPLLRPFDPSAPPGEPTGLPRRIGWANTADTQIFVALGRGMARAARDRGLEYVTAVAAGDPATNIGQIETFLARGVGGMAIQPLDQAAQRPVLERALRRGVCVQALISYPSVLQIAASQYEIGYRQGRAAADYAKSRLGARADVHIFNLDAISPQLRLRHRGVLEGLKTGGPGVRVVSDRDAGGSESISDGFNAMLTIMEIHPRIKIVLGGDTTVTGAYRAFEHTGRLAEDMYFSGVDGDSNALSLVKQGGPYRASLAFAWPLMGYAMGQFGADWIEGRQIPRVMVAKAVLLESPAAVDAYLADNAAPGSVFGDRERLERYLPLLGNVSYATRHLVWRQEYVPR